MTDSNNRFEAEALEAGGGAEARCPLCGLISERRVARHDDFPNAVVSRCSECEHWFAHPLPTPAELGVYYSTTYSVRRSWSATELYAKFMEGRAEAQARFMNLPRPDVHSAIDLGCGIGALAACMRAQGITTQGYDADPRVVELGRKRYKVDLVEGHVGIDSTLAPCDLLCLSHVVEHFGDPIVEFGALVRFVRPGGYIFVEVPNCIDWMFDRRVPMESHLGFFTARSVVRLAERLGLEVLRLRDCGPVIASYYAAWSRDRARGWAFLRRWLPKSVRRIVCEVLGVFRHPPYARNESEGFFDAYGNPGEPGRLWLRVLLKKPVNI